MRISTTKIADSSETAKGLLLKSVKAQEESRFNHRWLEDERRKDSAEMPIISFADSRKSFTFAIGFVEEELRLKG